jgi:hypothetical protein
MQRRKATLVSTSGCYPLFAGIENCSIGSPTMMVFVAGLRLFFTFYFTAEIVMQAHSNEEKT